MRIKRGLNSMRVRRRQSDAKWRASVASCYDTLKFVIPESGKLPKRKISKAVILQETDKHIQELEKNISNLLSNEASALNKSVLWRKGREWSQATLSHIRKEFEGQQAHLFEQSTQGRRKYSMLSDIEEEILHMTADTSKITVISHAKGSKISASNQDLLKGSQVANRAKIWRKELTKPCSDTISSQYVKKVRKNSNVDLWTLGNDSKNHLPVVCEHLPSANISNTFQFHSDCKQELRDQATSFNTPSKVCYTNDNENLFSPVPECNDFGTPVYFPPKGKKLDTKPSLTSPSLSKVAKQLDFAVEETSTPKRPSCPQDRLKDMCNIFGFTPIKLPSPELNVTPLRLPHLPQIEETPIFATPRASFPPQTPQSDDQPAQETDDEDDEETKSLLCFETFDLLEEAPEWEKTPKKSTEKKNTIAQDGNEKENKKICKKKFTFIEARKANRRNIDRVPKCRKNLERLYSSGGDVPDTLPVITGVFNKDSNCSDFDGYFLFYRQVVEELHQHMSRTEIASPSVAVLVSQMWSDMSTADRETMATLAALEGSQDSNSSSSLSDDLQELDVKPLNPSHFIDAERLGLFRNDLQTVPTVDNNMVHATVDRVLHKYNVQEVPVHLQDDQLMTNKKSEESSVFSIGIEQALTGSQYSVNDITLCSDYMDTESSQMVPHVSSVVKRDVLLSSSGSDFAITH